MRKPKWRGIRPSVLLPVGAFIAALIPVGYALDIWAHIHSRRPYDFWATDWTVGGGRNVVVWSAVAIGLSLIGCFFRYRWVALIVVSAALGGSALYFWGMSIVELVPDG